MIVLSKLEFGTLVIVSDEIIFEQVYIVLGATAIEGSVLVIVT